MSRFFFVVGALTLAAGCTQSTPEAAEASAETPIIMGGEVVDPAALAQAEAEEPTSQPSEEEQADPHASHGEEGGRPGPLAPGETGHYGAPFAIEGDAIELSAAIADCAGTGDACKVTGTVDRVCQNSGCWFTIAAPDVESTVRIRMVDYGFFVPRNAMGASVTFEGTLELLEVPEAEAQHYADDEAAANGGEARVVDGPELTYQFMITGVELTAAAGS